MTREEAITVLTNNMMATEELLNSLPPRARGKSSLNDKVESLKFAISALSQPERPKGRWNLVWHGEFVATLQCLVCGRKINVAYPFNKKTINRNYPYCHCGADMRGEEE